MNAPVTSPDVVVIGGGPAGSTVATLLAEQGTRCSFERAKFPRFHIGESLMPETYWVLQAARHAAEAEGAATSSRSTACSSSPPAGKRRQPFYFDDHKPHECSQTWQVAASEFDQMLLDNAREHGVDVAGGRERPRRAARRRPRRRRARCRTPTARAREVRAKVVVDASGQSRAAHRTGSGSASGTRCSTRPRSGPTRRARYRDPGQDDGATLVLQTPGQGRLVLVHPAARRRHQRRRRRALRRPVQGPRAHDLEQIYSRKSRTRPGLQAADRERDADRRHLPARSGLLLPRQAGSPATAGCSSATRSASSIRCTPPACSSP